MSDVDEMAGLDIFVAMTALPNHLFHNTGKGLFEENGLLAGWPRPATAGRERAWAPTPATTMGTDISISSSPILRAETHSLFRDLGGGLFNTPRPSGIGPATLPFVGFGTAFLDYDNDGLLDIAIINGEVIDKTAKTRPGSTHAQRRLLFRGVGARRFAEVGRTVERHTLRPESGVALRPVTWTTTAISISRRATTADVPALVNDGGRRRQSLLVRTVGVVSNREASAPA